MQKPRGLLLVMGWVLVTASSCLAQSRPNILWITSEDNAAHWMGCYGNSDANTPRIDALARQGARFTHAYSNAPVCAVARCTLLNGVYSVTLGTQHMRSRYPIPDTIVPYVTRLREDGYYCTNRSKTDYNFRGNDGALWDDCSGKAHYKNRPLETPFFAIFNLTVSHESSLFPAKVASNRKQGIIPKSTRLDPAQIDLPPYLPDLPEVRSDVAIYHDNLTALDRQVGELLDELEAAGLADNTIVFYYGDHGGPTPRGKRYLADTGVQVPMIVRCPEKWQHLSPFKPGTTAEELVAFVDLAPTLLSLVGEKKPTYMQGRAFLGAHRVEPADDSYVLLYGDRFDEVDGMRRGITDGRYKYIRRFTPYLPAAPYSLYAMSMPSWIAWQAAWQAGNLSGYQNDLWESTQPVEVLYDTTTDPWEIDNLAESGEHQEVLNRMRGRLRATMRDVKDTGLVPEAMFQPLMGNGTLYDFVRSDRFDLPRVLDTAFLATSRDASQLAELAKAMRDDDPVVRYWGIVGCLVLGPQSEANADALQQCLTDEYAANRILAARALHAVGQTKPATQALLTELQQSSNQQVTLTAINAITDIGAEQQVSPAWARRTLNDKNANEYVQRFCTRLLKNSE